MTHFLVLTFHKITLKKEIEHSVNMLPTLLQNFNQKLHM